ncbi:unnamed protein product [Aphanomyces euteiches]
MLRHALLRSLRQCSSLPTRYMTAAVKPNSMILARPALIPLLDTVHIREFSSKGERELPLFTFAEVKKLYLTNKEELINDIGKPAYFTMVKRLKLTWRDFCERTPYPSAADLKSYFNAGKALDMDTVLVETLLAMHKIFPKELKARHYMESRVAFLRLGKYNEMLEIFETEKREHPKPQPIFYVWALTACIELNNLTRIKELLAEMKHEGYMVPNETVSRLLFNLAKRSDKASILELFPNLDPNVGIWTVQALNRTLASLGMVGLPQEAFKFYGDSSMDLDATTFKTVLEIAVRNNCIKEATDILHNRALFDLKLDTPDYNIIIEALILLNRTDEIPLILQEMADARVPRNGKTENLVRTLSISSRSQARATKNIRREQDEQDAADIRQKLDKKQLHDAAALADDILARKKTPKLISPILEAYLATNQHDKIDAVVASMQRESWPAPMKGIILLLNHYCHRSRDAHGKTVIQDSSRAFEVYKASKAQKMSIHQPKQLYPVLMQLGEWEAAVELFEASLENENHPTKEVFRTTNTVRLEAFNDVVRTCAKMRQYKAMTRVVEKMVAHGHEVSPVVFNSMWFDPIKYSFHGISDISSKDRADLLTEFAAAVATSIRTITSHRPTFQPTYDMLNSLTNLLFYGNQRQTLLDLYRQAKHDPKKHALPEKTYQKLLQVATIYGRNLGETRELYAEAMAQLPDIKQPGYLEASLVRAIAQAGHMDEMLHFLAKHPSGNSFRGALEVLVTTRRFAMAQEVLQMMLDASFKPSASLMIKSLGVFRRAVGDNPAEPVPLTAFLDAFERQVVQNGQLVTKSQDGNDFQDISMGDIRRIYSMAVKIYEASNLDQEANALKQRMKTLGIRSVEGTEQTSYE